MPRHISEKFINELLAGKLSNLLRYVRSDHTLDMELRGVEVTVYYRGCKLLSIKNDSFELKPLDKKYSRNRIIPDISKIEEYIPKSKHLIDMWLVKNKKWETEIQQQIVRENNYSPSADHTDFFILDIEYKDDDIGELDIVAIRLDSTSKAHKARKFRITMFELKQGFNSIDGGSGLVEHYKNFEKFNADSKKVQNFISDMKLVFEQKIKLGLIPYLKGKPYSVISSMDDEIDYVFILANYKSASKKLKTAVNQISGNKCKFIYSNCMGYGLFSKNIIDRELFINMFKPK